MPVHDGERHQVDQGSHSHGENVQELCGQGGHSGRDAAALQRARGRTRGKNGLRNLRQLKHTWSHNWRLGQNNPGHKKLPGKKCGHNGQVVI